MKSSGKFAAFVSCVMLICGAGITWYLVKARDNERKLSEDARLCRVRAEQGDADAEYRLVSLYQQGKGVPQDYGEALRWYQRAAAQDNAKGQYAIGYMYYYGQGVPQNSTEAVRWCRKAAEHGYAKAEYALGSSYYSGQGVPQDRAMAAQWYRRAADHGMARAQYDLGYMYYYGQGVLQDRAEANRLFHEAADQGNEEAQRVLGLKGRHPRRWNKITLSIIFLGSLSLLISSLRPGQSLRDREQRTTALTGLLGLSYGGMELCWYLYVGLLQSSPATTAFYFAWHLLGGVSLAMLLSIVFPKGTKVVLGISGVSFIAFNLFAIAHNRLTHLARAAHTLSLANGLFIGMSIASAILLWLEGKRNRGVQSGNASSHQGSC